MAGRQDRICMPMEHELFRLYREPRGPGRPPRKHRGSRTRRLLRLLAGRGRSARS